jgi:SAM-dependent methyltransferase
MATDPQKIRPLYDAFGAEGYYRQFGNAYENPHQPEIKSLLEANWPRMRVEGAVLDLAAGGGEVSSVLLDLGHDRVEGCDPYTYILYTEKTGKPCNRSSFKDIIRAGLPHTYDLVICSFALHLCPEKELFPLCWQLFQASPRLVVLTPHKRPQLEAIPGIVLEWEDHALTERGKQVRLRAYNMP